MSTADTPAGTLADLMLSRHGKLRPRMRLMLVTLGVFLVWQLAEWIAWRMGLMSDTGFLLMSLVNAAPFLFYAAVRGGWTLELEDPALVLPQMLYACFAICCGYVLLPELRATILQGLCMVQMFGLFSLRPRQTAIAGYGAAALLAAAFFIALALDEPGFDPTVEALRAALACFVMILMSLLSRRYAGIRQGVREQKAELAAAVAQVNELVTHDALTGLVNRQRMQALLEQESARHARGGAAFAVALIDLDHFKQINDRHGHHVGDEALVGFAKVARTMLRETDTLARWGGEEFLALLPATPDEAQAAAVLERLREELSTLAPSSSAPALRIAFSAGIALHAGHEPPDRLLERADRALYAAKARGRSQSVVAARGRA